MLSQEISLGTALPLVKRCLRKKIVPYVVGSPALGKSAMAQQIADQGHLQLIDLRLADMDPTDLSGFGTVDLVNNIAKYVPFDTFPTAKTPIPKGKSGWLLLLDELSSCTRAVQASAHKLILDQKVGQEPLHPMVFIMAAGNLATDNAYVNSMSTAVKSRMVHFQVKADKTEWVNHAIDTGHDSRIIAYIEAYPSHLHTFDPKSKDHTFRAPRTWSMLSTLIKGEKITHDLIPLVNGVIGVAGGTEFRVFCDHYKELPPIADILKNPTKVKVPTQSSHSFAMSGILSDAINLANADVLMDYILRLGLEFQAICLRKAWRTNPQIIQADKVDKWLDLNSQRFY